MPFRINSWEYILTSAPTLNGMWINQDLEQDVGPGFFYEVKKKVRKSLAMCLMLFVVIALKVKAQEPS
jgi:hypothetical protein